MRVLFRADGDRHRGGGHVMRCLALAERVVGEGGEAWLASVALDARLEDRARTLGVDVLRAPAGVTVGDTRDATWTVERARALSVGWVVTDGYDLGPGLERAVQEAGIRQLLIDDLGRDARPVAELVVNQNLHATPGLYGAEPHDRGLLLGPAHALLAAGIVAVAEERRAPGAGADRVLVTMGAADPPNATARVLDGLEGLDAVGLRIRVAVGPANRHGPELRRRRPDPRVELVDGAPGLAPHLAWADLAIAAAGITTYELACVGVPTLLIRLAKNQEVVASGMAGAGAALDLGWHELLTPDAVAAAVSRLREDDALRARLTRRARALVDGKGTARVLAAMEAYSPPG